MGKALVSLDFKVVGTPINKTLTIDRVIRRLEQELKTHLRENRGAFLYNITLKAENTSDENV